MHTEDLDNNYHNFGTGKESSKASYCIKEKEKSEMYLLLVQIC